MDFFRKKIFWAGTKSETPLATLDQIGKDLYQQHDSSGDNFNTESRRLVKIRHTPSVHTSPCREAGAKTEVLLAIFYAHGFN